MSLWIQVVENIFKKRGTARQENLDTWLIETLPSADDLWRPKVKDKAVDVNGLTTDGGEEVSRS